MLGLPPLHLKSCLGVNLLPLPLEVRHVGSLEDSHSAKLVSPDEKNQNMGGRGDLGTKAAKKAGLGGPSWDPCGEIVGKA